MKHYQCRYCHRKENLTIDHIIPKARGGLNSPENKQSLCYQCNVTKGRYTDEEMAAILRDIKKRGVWYKWEEQYARLLEYIEQNRQTPLYW